MDILYLVDRLENLIANSRRMPVVNRDKRLVGIISLGDVACNEDLETAGDET